MKNLIAKSPFCCPEVGSVGIGQTFTAADDISANLIAAGLAEDPMAPKKPEPKKRDRAELED